MIRSRAFSSQCATNNSLHDLLLVFRALPEQTKMAAIEAQGRVQRAVEQLLDNLEKERLRPLLKEAHLGSAKCCDNLIVSKEQLEQCMQASFRPPQKIQEVISNELSQFQNRLSRCAQQCQDFAQDKVTHETTPTQVACIQSEMDKCIVKCCDDHVELLPKMMTRIHQALKQVQQS